MALTVRQKAAATFELLVGMRHPSIVEALTPHGWRVEVLDQGFALLRAFAEPAPDVVASNPQGNPHKAKLRELRNQWFPVARAALVNHPEAHQALLHGLLAFEGGDVVFAIGGFVRRADELANGTSRLGAQGPAVLQLLSERGLTAEVLEEFRAAFAQLAEDLPMPSRTVGERDSETIVPVWAFYQEWATLARGVIKDRSKLALLGLWKPKKKDG